MNTLTVEHNEIDKPQTSFITEAISALETVSDSQLLKKQVNAKLLLDRLFPLESGSHQDVTSYMIDYSHLLAYFKDGRHCGLKHPCHFTAYTGHRNKPDSILFRDTSGSHVEVTLGTHLGTGSIELTDIDDIQLEACANFTSTEETLIPTVAMRYWVSLVRGHECGKSQAYSEDKEYVSKAGGEYLLTYSFQP